MRFLCLHGRGTNSKIFEMQTAAIRYELGDNHTFDFVEGTMLYDIEPDVKSFLALDEKTFAYFDEDSPATALSAVKDLESFVETQGPYDGVIAFSQAVGLVGTWMIKQNRLGKTTGLKCAIFISGASPAVDFTSLEEGNVVLLSPDRIGQVIQVPTTHVWGSADPWNNVARDFSQLCKADVRSILIHEGGHEVPGSGSKDVVTKIVNFVRRTILLSQAETH